MAPHVSGVGFKGPLRHWRNWRGLGRGAFLRWSYAGSCRQIDLIDPALNLSNSGRRRGIYRFLFRCYHSSITRMNAFKGSFKAVVVCLWDRIELMVVAARAVSG